MSSMEERILNYYQKFFSQLPQDTMFELYDIAHEKWFTFPGREASAILSRDRLIKNLSELEIVDKKTIETLIVMVYKSDKIAFTDPVFIGAKDCFKG